VISPEIVEEAKPPRPFVTSRFAARLG